MEKRTKMPLLRFSEFKDEWKTEKLGDISTFLDGQRKPIKEADRAKIRGNYPYYGASGIIDYVNDYIFDEDIILLGEDGENIVSRNLPLAFVVKGKSWINNHAHVIKPHAIYNIHFIAQVLENLSYEQYNTGTAQPKLNQQVCRSIPINIASSLEQHKIADFMNAVNNKIEQLTAKKGLLEKYKKGIMQQIFNQEIRFKDENGNAYPNWEEKMLADVAIINPRNGDLPFKFIYIDLESVENGSLIKETEILASNAPSRAQRILKQGDIIYQTVRPYQRNNLLFMKRGNYVASTGYAVVRANENIEYLYQYLHSDIFVNDVITRCTGTSYPSINSKDLEEIFVKIPCQEEQKKIGEFLSLLEDQIKCAGKILEKTEIFKKGLLQQMFI